MSERGRRAVAGRFSAAAATYAEAATVQRRVVEALADWLPAPAGIDAVLDVGCGTGALTAVARRRYPQATVTAIDVAPGMIERARQAIGDERVRWEVGDAGNYAAKRLFPLIVSSSALHWMLPLETTFRQLSGLLSPGGQLVAALMVDGTLAELRQARARVAPGKPAAIELPAVEAVLAALAAANWSVREAVVRQFVERHASVEAMLASLRAQGVTGLASSGARPLNRSEVRQLIKEYGAHQAAGDGGVVATYAVLMVRAGWTSAGARRPAMADSLAGR